MLDARLSARCGILPTLRREISFHANLTMFGNICRLREQQRRMTKMLPEDGKKKQRQRRLTWRVSAVLTAVPLGFRFPGIPESSDKVLTEFGFWTLNILMHKKWAIHSVTWHCRWNDLRQIHCNN